MPGIEPAAFHMQSERATTALHPLYINHEQNIEFILFTLYIFSSFQSEFPLGNKDVERISHRLNPNPGPSI